MERIHLVNKAIYVGISICVAKINGCTGSVQFNLVYKYVDKEHCALSEDTLNRTSADHS